ncbi:hypothetical protein RFI_01814 [Reticulomyxa filosa]|uniref:Nucleoside phosphorylase domain-containing protein n=1 Tax=Reticulomyxa filosa TaxID=46433 RepID=X6PC55_RETFI|nr:hypothetical protein RFI_01814 [Reticulomyxa filosa]|eukprot:ETO35252.1 hypothetical protein RFI_01814 [Reticulomyxa filosa]
MTEYSTSAEVHAADKIERKQLYERSLSLLQRHKEKQRSDEEQGTEPPTPTSSTHSFTWFGLHSVAYSWLEQHFKDVELIIICGSSGRAQHIATELYSKYQKFIKLFTTIGDGNFFEIYKCGPVLVCSHGIGLASVDIFLNELMAIFKTLSHFKFKVIRLGSCGGVGVKAGTLVISTQALHYQTVEPEWHVHMLGEKLTYSGIFDEKLVQMIHDIATELSNRKIKEQSGEEEKEAKHKVPKVVVGKTFTAETFYEGQARLDGAFCKYHESNKQEFMIKLVDLGVKNIEMEGVALAGICNKYTIPSAMIAVAFVNRLESDTIPAQASPQDLKEWMEFGVEVIIEFIHKHVFEKLETASNN